jgi:signal transduction histidine kinase
VKNARNPLQDSGLPDSRLLARLLQAGLLVLDERDRLHFASAGACELFGAASEVELRAAWGDVGSQLHVDDWPRNVPESAAYHGCADVRTPAGIRAVRFEMHAVADTGRVQRVVLVRDRGRLLPTDRALLLASEAQANRHVLVGLVHAANGPLNNFNLTLALLATSIARTGTASVAPEVAGRWTRYVEVLRNETARLARFVEDIHALTLPHEAAREAIDLCALSRECARVLRHDATIREIELALDAPDATIHAMGDPQLVRLALLALTICLLDVTPPGGRIGWRLSGSNGASATVAIATSLATLPSDLVASLFRLSCTAESPWSAAIAGRLIIEAQGGDVALDSGVGQSGFRIHIPARG